MQDLVTSQVTASAVVVMILQWLKRSNYFPWLSGETETLNKAVAAIAAAFTAVGIHYSYDADLHTITITGITLTAFVHGAWHWLQAFSFQELIYRGALKPRPALTQMVKP